MAAKKKTPKIQPASKNSTKPESFNLSEFEMRFCQEYIKDLNATQAYLRARIDKEIKSSTANVEGCKLLAKPNVQAKVEHLASERSARTQIDGDKVLTRVDGMAKTDPRRLYDENGALLPPHLWPDDVALSVQSVETTELFEQMGSERIHIGYTKKVKFWDKVKSNELLGKHLKLFSDRVEHSGTVSLADLVLHAKKKETSE
jgi:phage terminase small subunit